MRSKNKEVVPVVDIEFCLAYWVLALVVNVDGICATGVAGNCALHREADRMRQRRLRLDKWK